MADGRGPSKRRTRSGRCASAASSRSSSATRRASARPSRMLGRGAPALLARRGRRRRVRRDARPQGDRASSSRASSRLPLKHLTYRGKEFEELDTDAVIARRPEWVLVDELAHTNVPGARHEKRWQSVAEIQAAGHQRHHHGQHPARREPERHRVRDHRRPRAGDRSRTPCSTRPTRSCSSTSRPPRCSTACRRGVVYDLDKIPGALANFFKRENLVALRELALRKTAEEVDEFLERITQGEEALHPWAAEERILVCIRPNAVAAKLIRRGHRLAKRFQGRFWVLHVRTHAQVGGGRGGRAAVRARRGAGREERRGGGRRGRGGDPAVRPGASHHVHRPRPVAAAPG